jgi:hypothetical protein
MITCEPQYGRLRLPRVEQVTGRVSYRISTVRKRLFRENCGFVTVQRRPCHGIATRPISQWGVDQRGLIDDVPRQVRHEAGRLTWMNQRSAQVFW